jgi:hypothetical protein
MTTATIMTITKIARQIGIYHYCHNLSTIQKATITKDMSVLIVCIFISAIKFKIQSFTSKNVNKMSTSNDLLYKANTSYQYHNV